MYCFSYDYILSTLLCLFVIPNSPLATSTMWMSFPSRFGRPAMASDAHRQYNQNTTATTTRTQSDNGNHDILSDNGQLRPRTAAQPLTSKSLTIFTCKNYAPNKIIFLKSLPKGVAIWAGMVPNMHILNPPLRKYFFIPVCNYWNLDLWLQQSWTHKNDYTKW